MSSQTTVVVGVGSVHESDPVLPAAAAVARRMGARLRVVHAFTLPEPMFDAYARMGYLDAGMIDRYGEEFQRRLEAQAEQNVRDVDLEVECRAVAGPASQVLHDEAVATGCELIVVGSSHRGAVSRLFLGTTAEATIRSSPVPVLVVRAEGEPVARRVLLTTDLSEMSAQVHDRGLRIARQIAGGEAPDARSLLVVAYDTVVAPPLRTELLEEAAEVELSRFLENRRAEARSLDSKVRFGEPSREILAEAAAWKPDLLVVGTHGRRGLARLLLGSVAGSVLRAAPCHVLVIPPAPKLGEPESTEGVEPGSDAEYGA